MSVIQMLPLVVDTEAVRRFQIIVAPGADELAVALKHQHGLRAAMQDVHAIGRIGGHARHRAQLDVVGYRWPTRDRAIVGNPGGLAVICRRGNSQKDDDNGRGHH